MTQQILGKQTDCSDIYTFSADFPLGRIPSVLSVAHFAVKDYHKQNQRNAVGRNHWQIVFDDTVEEPEYNAGIHGQSPEQADVAGLSGSDDSESLGKKRQSCYDSCSIAKVLGFMHHDRVENSQIVDGKIEKGGTVPRLLIIGRVKCAYLPCSAM
jgi:hypothetical protein